MPPIVALLPTADLLFAPLPLLLQDAVATSSHLQKFSPVRQLFRDLQQQKPRHRKRLQLPLGDAGSYARRIEE